MKKQLLLLLAGIAFCIPATGLYAQEAVPSFKTIPDLRLPRDSGITQLLFHSLDGFLRLKDLPAAQNKYIWAPELTATAALTDELKNIEQNEARKEPHFYQGYVTNILPLADGRYLLQLSYLAIDSARPALKASCRLMAVKEGDGFRFYSPLSYHSRGWQQKVAGNTTFFYKDRIDTAKMRIYQHYSELYEAKLGVAGRTNQFYCCNNLEEVLRLIGVDYQSDYNGNNYGSVSAHEGLYGLSVNGTLKPDFRNFDPHDMWHAKLRGVMAPEKINKAVDEGCAFLYGGSWGLSWEEIKSLFKDYRQQQSNADWLQLYNDGVDFKEGKEPLKIAYFINALLIQQLEKEKGFPPVMELLACGPQQKGNDNYFKALEALTGITRTNFNKEVNTLMQSL